MCGRFTLTDPSPRRLTARFDLDGTFEIDERPRFNIAPTDPVIAIRRTEEAKMQAGRLRWGLLPGIWATKKGQRPLINARAEGLSSQPAFKESFERRRCLIPADGFYEWRAQDGAKQPYVLRPRDARPLAFAGLWEHWQDDGGSELESCTILVRAADRQVGTIHDRMPVIIAPQAFGLWLDSKSQKPQPIETLLAAQQPPELDIYPVGRAVNNPRNDAPALLDPIPEVG